MKRTDDSTREDDERMRRVMDRLRHLVENLPPRHPAPQHPTGRRNAAVSGEIVD